LKTLLIIFILFLSISGIAQVVVKGKITDQNNMELPFTYVAGKKNSKGSVADQYGKYSIKLNSSDTLIFSCVGYELKKIFVDVKDSATQTINVNLIHKVVQLKPVIITGPRTYEEIQEELKKIKPYQYQVHGISSISSPITYLYERFSRFGKSSRKVSELETEDIRRDAMKELLAHYISYDLIKLSASEFDDFISFCNFTDEFIITANEYDLVMAVKTKYKMFAIRR